ncbi:MAG TPA: Uma2 family endonuclease [Polyangiaceae bacterium]|nr:Uma2 family endonuclease [Polyangiaceae bacterium]
MTAARPIGFTEAEYLALEAAGDHKHELAGGVVTAMAGATPVHNALCVRLSAALLALCGGRDCVVLSSDQRVHVPATGLYAYPGVSVACGERRYKNDKPPSLLNPVVLVEVTSDSTEDYDRGKKFLHYQAIESLREYMVVSHSEQRIDHHRRLDSGQWLVTAHLKEDALIEVGALSGTIRLRDVYGGLDLTEGE